MDKSESMSSEADFVLNHIDETTIHYLEQSPSNLWDNFKNMQNFFYSSNNQEQSLSFRSVEYDKNLSLRVSKPKLSRIKSATREITNY